MSRLTDEKDAFGFKKGQIEDYLTQRGFTRVVDVSADQLTRNHHNAGGAGNLVNSI